VDPPFGSVQSNAGPSAFLGLFKRASIGTRFPERRELTMERIGFWIGGKIVPGESGRTGPVYNPATGEQTHEVDFATPQEVSKAV